MTGNPLGLLAGPGSWLSLNTKILYWDITHEDAIVSPMNPEKQGTIFLNCKMCENHRIEKKTGFIVILDDMRTEEKLSYLLLGMKKSKDSGDTTYIGIIVTEVDPSLYRRVGCFVAPTAASEVWNVCERTKILLE